MTIRELIQKVAEEKPNSFTEIKLISFVNEVEVEVAEQLKVSAPVYTDFYVLPTEQPTVDLWNDGKGWYIYEDSEYISQEGEEFDPTKVYYMEAYLLAPPPYDQLYVSYLKSQIDYANEEMANYQNNAAQHTQDFRDFVDWVVSTKQVTENTFPTKIRNIM